MSRQIYDSALFCLSGSGPVSFIGNLKLQSCFPVRAVPSLQSNRSLVKLDPASLAQPRLLFAVPLLLSFLSLSQKKSENYC